MTSSTPALTSTDSRIAIVTGAGSGIGQAVALALLADGWRVVLAGRRREPLAAVATQAAAGQALVQPTDVCQPESVRALFDAAVAHFGRVDLLFNNAGVSAFAVPLDELTPEDWRRVVDTNLSACSGAFRACLRSPSDPTIGR